MAAIRSSLIPAIRPDVAIFHAPMADRFGNVWIGRRPKKLRRQWLTRPATVLVNRGAYASNDSLLATNRA
jgi:glutaconate CoA-transferase subunit A